MSSAPEREYIRIANWSELQARQDKRLPWCKLYADILDSEEWTTLTAHLKVCLTELWMMATKHGNQIPVDLAKRNTVCRTQDIRKLVEAGLIEFFTKAPEARGFRDLAKRMSDKRRTKTKDADLDTEVPKDRPTTPNEDLRTRAVVAVSEQRQVSAASTRQRPGGMDSDDWERLNGRVKQLFSQHQTIDSIIELLSRQFTKRQILSSIKACRDRGWIR